MPTHLIPLQSLWYFHPPGSCVSPHFQVIHSIITFGANQTLYVCMVRLATISSYYNHHMYDIISYQAKIIYVQCYLSTSTVDISTFTMVVLAS